jgi:hypothetical protein
MVFRNVESSGLELDSDYPGTVNGERRATLARCHPFFRNERFRDEPPRVIRWMWHPPTGDALLGTGDRHADILHRYQRKARRKMVLFALWLRGFFFPRTGELVMRPFNVAAANRDGDWAYSDRMQRHVRRLVERQLERRIPERRFHMNATNQWLAHEYGGRW